MRMVVVTLLLFLAGPQVAWSDVSSGPLSACDAFSFGRFSQRHGQAPHEDKSFEFSIDQKGMRTISQTIPTVSPVMPDRSSDPFIIKSKLETVMLGGRCVPIKSQRETSLIANRGSVLYTTWSLADCAALHGAMTDDEFKKCQNLDWKLEKALGRQLNKVSVEYGFGLTTGQTVAALIRNICRSEPLTAELLKDPDVTKYLLNQTNGPATAPSGLGSGNRRTKP